MSRETCTLTTKDFTILEVMRDRCQSDDPLLPILRRKLDAANVVFRDDVAPGVATLSSRVTYSFNGGAPECRVLSHDRMVSAVGMFLPITTPRGLSLLGLAEGDLFELDGAEVVRLATVNYQPEAERRRKELRQTVPARPARPILRLIRGAQSLPAPQPVHVAGWNDDDPGPSAA